jgi:2-polyprenyl-3-methyl-5-hydroxy-6-metoxy-1,4-benzoquinol methylase
MPTPPSPAIATPSADQLEQVTCCLMCGSGEHDVATQDVRDFYFDADPGTFTYLRCRNCGSLWLQARPVGERLARAYSAYYTHTAPPPPPPKRGGIRGILREAYLRARFAAKDGTLDRMIVSATRMLGRDNANIDEQFRFAPKAPARILDYGCGSGEYLLRMQTFGHQLHGVEYDPQLLMSLAEREIAIDDVASITDDRWYEEFDHITLAHVLEHVTDPGALLCRLFGWLKPGGTLFIEVPNGDATGLAIFGRYWRGLEAPRHFSLSNRESTIAALQQAGFRVVRQHISNNARERVWGISLGIIAPEERAAVEIAIANAPAEDETNAEFLTFVAQRPAL